MSRATNDLGQVRLLLGFATLNVVNTVFALVSAFAFTFSVSVKLTLAALVVVPFLVVVTRGFARHVFRETRANQDAIGELSALVQSSLSGVRVVRSFAVEDREIARFDQKNAQYLEASLRLARLRGLMGR